MQNNKASKMKLIKLPMKKDKNSPSKPNLLYTGVRIK
jgi:hypothetical protein